MEIINKKIEELKPYKNNPRNNEKAVDYVANSIKEFGFKVPIIIDKNNEIIAGHTRLKASMKLGLKEVPCIIADDLTEEQVRAFRLADNKVSEIAEWDFDLLEQELAEIQDIDMSMLDFDLSSLEDEEEKEVIEDDYEVEIPEEPKAKYGDIYQLGNHRLMCGDSTKEEDVAKLMNGVKADMVFTDPPYGMKKENDGVANDNLNYDDLLEFNKKWIPLTFENLKDMGGWYCWGIDEPLFDIYSNILKPLIKANQLVFRNYITWAKHSAFGMKSSLALSYPKETEKCLFAIKGKNWNNNNVEFFNTKYEKVLNYLQQQQQNSGMTRSELEKICGVKMYSHWFTKAQFTFIPKEHYLKIQNHYKNYFKKSYEEVKDMIGEDNNLNVKPYIDITWFDDGDIPLTDVWRQSITSQKERELTGGHATPKPIKLCERAIKTSSQENQIVLDLFGGSGSTLIACEQNNRNCYVMELEPKWVDVIIQRWENFTGEKAIKLN